MKRLLIVAILGLVLTGCSNTKELIFGNINVIYFPKSDIGTRSISFGSPSRPYAQESVKFYFKDGFDIDLSSKELIKKIQNRCSNISRDVSGKSGPFSQPAQSKKAAWPSGTFAYNISGLEIYYNNGTVLGFDTCDFNNDLVAIEVKGIRKNFPLTESDVKDLFGTPDKVLLYFSE